MRRLASRIRTLMRASDPENVLCNVEATLQVLTCPRCRQAATQPLGDAGSLLDWFTCSNCRYVWPAITRRANGDSAPAWRLLRTRLVIVDDDTSLLRALTRALSAYHPLMAQSAAEALTLVQHCRPDLLLTDYFMPNITGAELVGYARELHPTMKVVMLTGHNEFVEQEPWMRDVRRLVKPCGVQQLQQVVAEMIGAPPVARPDDSDWGPTLDPFPAS